MLPKKAARQQHRPLWKIEFKNCKHQLNRKSAFFWLLDVFSQCIGGLHTLTHFRGLVKLEI